MDVSSLKAHIKTKELPHIMIFAGDEWQVQKIYIEQIAKALQLENKRVDAVSDILPALRNKSFVKQSFLYVIRDDKEFVTSEKLQNYVTKTIENTASYLILFITKLDKRTKFYTSHKDMIVEFTALPDMWLKKYIKNYIPDMSERNCNTFIELCEHDYGRILLEIDKVKNWHDAYVEDKEQDIGLQGAFLRLVTSGVIYRPPADAIFDLVEAILMRDVEKSFALLEESYASGEATMVMLTVLFNNAKAVLQVQTCTSNNVSKSTGLTSWQIMNAKKVAGHYKEAELIKMIHKIKEVETKIKTGKIEDKFAMDYLLLSIL